MMVTVFRSRLKPGTYDDLYLPLARKMTDLAKGMPGYVSHKVFVAEDGERLTLVEFADEASLDAWARQRDHLAAKSAGRRDFYEEYSVQVCREIRRSAFKATADGS